MTEIISAAIAGLASGYLVGRLTGNAIKKQIATSTPRTVQPKRKITRKKHHRRTWTQTEIASLKALIRQGYSQNQIAKLLGRPQSSVANRIKKHQLV
jgi:DNA-binding NarL/FixJ family response regulator